MGIDWSENFKCGIREIDDQHKEFFIEVDRFLKTCKTEENAEQVKKMMKELQNHIDTHFRAEEVLFKKYKYPYGEFHIKEHRKFKKDFNFLRRVFRQEGVSLRFSMLVGYFSSSWIFDHIKKADKNFSEFLKKRNPFNSRF